MLQKIHFNMLVKSNRVQIKYKNARLYDQPCGNVGTVSGGKSDKSSKSYPGTRERKRNVYNLHIVSVRLPPLSVK